MTAERGRSGRGGGSRHGEEGERRVEEKRGKDGRRKRERGQMTLANAERQNRQQMTSAHAARSVESREGKWGKEEQVSAALHLPSPPCLIGECVDLFFSLGFLSLFLSFFSLFFFLFFLFLLRFSSAEGTFSIPPTAPGSEPTTGVHAISFHQYMGNGMLTAVSDAGVEQCPTVLPLPSPHVAAASLTAPVTSHVCFSSASLLSQCHPPCYPSAPSSSLPFRLCCDCCCYCCC